MRTIKYIDECEVGLVSFWELFSSTYPNMPERIWEYIATCYNDTSIGEAAFVDYWNDLLWDVEQKGKKTISCVFPLEGKDKITITFKRAYVESED